MRGFLVGCCFLIGCAPGHSVLTVNVGADPPLSSVTSLNVTVLDMSHSPSRTASTVVSVNGPIPPKQQFSLVLPADISGTVTVKIDAVGATASASQTVAVRPSEVMTVEIDLGGGDDGGVKTVGDPCTVSPCSMLLESCTSEVQGLPFPGSYCTTVCNSGQAMSNCTSVGGDCQYVQGLLLCLQRCHPSAGMMCRNGYSCCTGSGVTTSSGWCAPSSSSTCGF